MSKKLSEMTFPAARIESLTDGIFAFAMTLLVINLNAPILHGLITNEQLVTSLLLLKHRFFVFLLSFFLLASAWGVHHRQFSVIHCADNRLMWINMARLLLVIMVPFSSTLVGNYGELPAAAVFFDLNIFLLSLFSFIEWRYARSKGFIEGLDGDHLDAGDIKNLIPIVICGISALTGFFYPILSLWLFALIPVATFIFKRAGKII